MGVTFLFFQFYWGIINLLHFEMVEKSYKKIRELHNTWKLCEMKISIFINKVLLGHIHSHSFTYWLADVTAQWQSCIARTDTVWLASLKYLLSLLAPSTTVLLEYIWREKLSAGFSELVTSEVTVNNRTYAGNGKRTVDFHSRG